MKPFKCGKTYWVDFVVAGVKCQQSLHTKSKAVNGAVGAKYGKLLKSGKDWVVV